MLFIYIHIVLFIIPDVLARMYWSCILSQIAFKYTEIKIVRVFVIKVVTKLPTNMLGMNATGMGSLDSLDSIYK